MFQRPVGMSAIEGAAVPVDSAGPVESTAGSSSSGTERQARLRALLESAGFPEEQISESLRRGSTIELLKSS